MSNNVHSVTRELVARELVRRTGKMKLVALCIIHVILL